MSISPASSCGIQLNMPPAQNKESFKTFDFLEENAVYVVKVLCHVCMRLALLSCVPSQPKSCPMPVTQNQLMEGKEGMSVGQKHKGSSKYMPIHDAVSAIFNND